MDYCVYPKHAMELNTLPKTYPLEKAIHNNDIVVNPSNPNNTERFYEFLSNIGKGKTDKIRITRYGYDNLELAIKTILEYNGTFLIFSLSDGQVSPVTYYGNEIIYRYRQPDGPWQYFLKKCDGGEELVFNLYKYGNS